MKRYLLKDYIDILKKENLARKKSDVVENIKTIKKSILAKSFRSELGTNYENEESAIKLLEEIAQNKEVK